MNISGKRRVCALLAMAASVSIQGAVLWAADSPTFHYVRSDAPAGGNGSSWAAAWTAAPSALVRGHTYYIGDGVYPRYAFDDPESGSTYITIRKATQADHGTDTGWTSAYGDGVAEFTGSVPNYAATLEFDTGCWVFDGAVGSGNSGYGFKVSVTNNDTACRNMQINAGSSNITILHTEMQLAGTDNNYAQDCFYSNDGPSSNITLSYCYLHDISRNVMTVNGWTNCLIEHCRFENAKNQASEMHSQALQFGPSASHIIIRYNVFKNIDGTGHVVGLMGGTFDHFDVYGNVFWATSSQFVVSNGAVTVLAPGCTATDFRVHNNTMVGLKGLNSGVMFNSGSNNSAYNNLWYDCASTGFSNVDRDYNTYVNSPLAYYIQPSAHDVVKTGAPDPFSASASGDFHLNEATDPGLALLNPFDTDMDGNSRGADGVWDRGALEYVGIADTTPPSVPTNLSATAASHTEIDLSWTASTDNVRVAGYKIFRGGALAGTATGTAYADTGLSPSTDYSYRVLAYDAARNESALSSPAPARTQDPPAAEIRIDDAAVIEGATGATTQSVFHVTLTWPSQSEVRVDYATSPGTATAGTDYVSASGTLTFAPGTVSQYLPVTVNGDADEEPDETFFVNLSNPVGAPIADGQGIGTILNDDGQVSLGLVGYWRFDEGSGGTAADSSGLGNTGTLTNGPTWTTGKVAGGLRFNGTNSFVQVGTNAWNAGAGSLVVWAYPEGFTAAPHYLFGHSSDSWTNRIQLYTADASGNLNLGLGDSHTRSLSIQTLPLQTWTHIVLTWDGSSYVVYVNGVAKANGTYAGLAVIQNHADIGNTGNTLDRAYAFNGIIDEGRVYNRVLTPEEVALLYNSGSSGTPVVSVDDIFVVEGVAGTSDAVFTVRLSAPSDQEVTVDYVTVDGTATAEDDYTPVSGTLIFPAGTTSRPVPIPIKGDTIPEPSEAFYLDLSNPVNATLAGTP